jgi:Zn-dependent protease
VSDAAEETVRPAGPPPVASPEPPPRARWGGAIGLAVLAVLVKAKSLLVLLKGVKVAKLFITMGSMFVMIWFEAVRYGWLFGVGFVVLLLIHELGHGVAIRRAGLSAGYPVFIPFVGAFISLKDQIRSPITEADIALAGPIAGTAASTACVALYFATGERLWVALAHTGFFLNLFNMTPIAPLDGGRAARVFSRKAWILGLGILVALFAVTQAPQLLLIGFMALSHTFSRRAAAAEPDADLEAVPPEARRNVAFQFFGLCAFLALGTYLTGTVLSRPHA